MKMKLDKFKNTILFSIVFLWFGAVLGQTQIDSIYVAKFKSDKSAAISYTFDDGVLEHYTLVYPELEKRDFKGTFWINGNTIEVAEEEGIAFKLPRISWNQLKEMSDSGHEISNHGWSHKYLPDCTSEEMNIEIEKNDSIIEAKVGERPVTFCYAGNRTNKEVVRVASANRVGTRTTQYRMGRKSTPEELKAKVDTLIANKEWITTMIHGINTGYDIFKTEDLLWDHFDYVKSREDKIWVDTFRAISAYTAAQEDIKLDTAHNGDAVIVSPESSLDPQLFDVPLTMVVQEPGIQEVLVRQDGKELAVEILPEKAVFNFDPHGGDVSIEIEKQE